MAKLTEKQKEFLKKHGMWNAKKDKSTLGMFEKGDFKDFFRRKEKLEEELARLPDDDTKRDLLLKLQAAEEKAKNKKFKEAYKDLDEVKLDARKEADDYVAALSPAALLDEVNDWRLEGENLDGFVKQLDAGLKTTKSEFAKVPKATAFDSGAAADKFLQSFHVTENLVRNHLDGVKDTCTKVESYLGKNDPAAKLQDFSHQLSMLRKEKNANVGDLNLKVESAHVYFIHEGKTLKAGEYQLQVDQLGLEIEKTLEERKKEATFLANQAKWKERSGPMSDKVLKALKTNPIERSQIEGLWALANGRAEKGGEADVAMAVSALEELEELLKNTTPEDIGSEDGVAKTGAALVEARKLQSAQVILNTNVKAADAALKRIRLEFQPALPQALDVQAQKLDGLIAPTTETDPIKVENLAKSIATETLELDKLAVAPRNERAAWIQELAAFEMQLASLSNHPLKDDATVVKPLIDKLKEDLGKAKDDANLLKWKEATAAVKLLVPRCETAMQTADGLAHFDTIRQERADRIATLPTGVIAQEQARKAVEATKKLLTDADLDKAANKYADAIAKLDQIPDAVTKTLKLVKDAADYAATLLRYQNRVTELGNFTGDAGSAIAAGLAIFTDRVEKAKFETTKDYSKSVTQLGQTWVQYLSLKAKAEQAVAYKTALDELEVRFKEVEDHEGRIAIEEFYKRLEADETFANARKLAGEYHVGTQILNSSKPLHAAQIALAEIGKSYKEKHKKAGEDLTEIEKKGNKGKATEAIAEARKRITAAESAATAKDWPGALKAIEAAATAIAAVDKLLADDKALADLKDNGKLAAIATDFNAAYGVYQAMRSHVAGKDTGGVFTTKLNTADAPAQRAQTAATTDPRDFNKAKSELEAAIGICEEVILLISKKAPYEAALAVVKNAHTTTLPAENEDNCINPKLTEIGQAIARAENLAKTPTFNFDGAQQEIGTTMVKVREAELSAKAYKSMKADKRTIKETLDFLKEPARSAGVDREIKRLEEAQTSITNDVNAQKFDDAVKTASATAKACPALKRRGELYERVKTWRKRYVQDELPSIEGVGKEAAAIELKQAQAVDAEIKRCFDIHLYDMVEQLVVDAMNLIKAGKEIVTAHGLYETVRKDVDTKLTDTLPNRNTATEERYDALRNLYQEAVKLASAERNYKRAKAMLSTIPAKCDGLAADAQAFRDYEESRKKAGEKLSLATKDKQAQAVRPLLGQLQNRHAAAVKIGNGGDYKGAKKLLDEVFADAEKALTTASEAANYAATADDIKKPGTAINDAIAKAENLYKALMLKKESLYAVSTLAGINKTIEAARKDAATDEEKARTSLVQVVDACAKARILMGHYEQMEAAMTTLEQDINTFLSTHAQRAFVKNAVERLLGDIETARREARGTGDHIKANKQIQTAETAFIAQRRAADAHIKYVESKDEVELDLVKMDKHASRHAIVAAIASVRKDLAQAALKAAAHDHKAAMALLEQAAGTALDALLQAKMHNESVEPTEAEVKKILEGKDGSKRLDAIVATLDAKAKRKVLDVAFAARFGCKLLRFANKTNEDAFEKWMNENPNATPLQIQQKEDLYREQDSEKKAPDVRRFYDLMCELPDTHTKDNDSMQVFVQLSGPAKGSDYGGGRKKVAMREGDVATSGVYGIALAHEIDEVEAGCELDKGEPITFFNWNTVHEVGHAVDDKLGFMSGKGKSYAGWTEYGMNVRPIAEAVAKKFKFDVAYVASYMLTGTAVSLAKVASDGAPGDTDLSDALAKAEAEAEAMTKGIPKPKDCDADEWERRRVACVNWVDSARASKNPWQSASTAKALAIGDTVYHESYDWGSWASYKLSARKQGVTGYQFRAPGEWFSELYAAFHTKKMKSSHPAYAWLQKL